MDKTIKEVHINSKSAEKFSMEGKDKNSLSQQLHHNKWWSHITCPEPYQQGKGYLYLQKPVWRQKKLCWNTKLQIFKITVKSILSMCLNCAKVTKGSTNKL